MTYSNATFYLDLESGSDAARTALTSVAVANNGAGLVRCTKVAHGLVSGAVVDNTTNYTGAWIVTRIDADNFDLVGSTYSTSTALTATPRGGSSKADAWLTVGSGATAARHAAGDTIRVKASLDETAIGDATWTDASKTVTLAGAVTANIATCETAWTASANVTSTADTSVFKENTKSAKHVFASGFTTGLAAYFATGTLDLSGYQQVSFWFRNDSAAVVGSNMSLRLCSDTAGVTAVNTISIPAIPGTGRWMPITVDTGGALGSAIASVALYCDIDPGTQTIYIDNIIACKASSSADSLTLTSLIGKVHNLSWVASTTYAANAIRRPTQPNRNGYRYKVTAGGGGAAGGTEPTWPTSIGLTVTDGALTWTCDSVEDTWYGIQSINGTTVKLDNGSNTLGSAGRGYSGTTETVATYKREPTQLALTSGGTIVNDFKRDGTPGALITYSGGWNRTDMSTQTGETWNDMRGVANYAYFMNNGHIALNNWSHVRGSMGFLCNSGISYVKITNCHYNNMSNNGLISQGSTAMSHDMFGVVCNNNDSTGFSMGNTVPFRTNQRAVTSNNNLFHGVQLFNEYNSRHSIVDLVTKNNTQYGISQSQDAPGNRICNWLSAGNGSGGIDSSKAGGTVLVNSLVSDSTVYNTSMAGDQYLYFHKYQQTANDHRIFATGGSILSATDQRHTASGLSWKFKPTSTLRAQYFPLRLSIAKVVCAANTAKTVSLWVRRDSTNINGTLKVEGGQLTGISQDCTTACAPTINTWTQYSLTFTPTEAGVVEVLFECYDYTGTTNSLWIDDFTEA